MKELIYIIAALSPLFLFAAFVAVEKIMDKIERHYYNRKNGEDHV